MLFRSRTRDEETEWRAKDPLVRLGSLLVEEKQIATASDLERVEAEVEEMLQTATRFAEESPEPEPEDALLHVFWEEN